MKLSWKFILPLAVFGGLALLLGRGLSLNPREVPSPLIGKPAPAFSLSRLDDASTRVTAQQFAGQVWILNVFASWCTPCLEEHPLLLAFAKQSKVPLVGLNYKDARTASQQWLVRHGNPYAATVWDHDGRVGLDYGVYGVPETFVIDRTGVIRFKHIGPLTPQVMQNQLMPLLKELGA